MAGYRHRLIDRMLQGGKSWNFEGLLLEINECLNREFGLDGISDRTLKDDVQLMRMEFPEGFGAPIKRAKGQIFYTDPGFTIRKAPLPEKDLALLEEAVGILQQTQALPVADSLQNALYLYRGPSKEKQHPVIWLDRNDQVQGLQWLDLLYRAARLHFTLTIHYQSFSALGPSTLTFCPYILREFNHRWFAIGWVEEERTSWVLALDRIKNATESEAPWRPNTFFDPNERFAHIIGVSIPDGEPVSQIRLRFAPNRAPYILTKPIHDSQKLTASDPDGTIEIEVNLIVNLELESLILSFGKDVEVLAPPTLRQKIAETLQAASASYYRYRF